MHATDAGRAVHGQLGGNLLRLVQIRSEEVIREMTAGPERILLAHGGGGQLMSRLIQERILPKFRNETLSELADAAHLALPSGDLCFTTDSYVVKPLFFRGGDIGKLAVCGTVNDLAVSGARPLVLSLSLIIEEGLPFARLRRLLASVRAAADEAGVIVACGDTKVVESGKADGLYITTSGIGEICGKGTVSIHNAVPGDAVIVSGEIGLHGVAVMAARQQLGFASVAKSDVAPLNRMLEPLLKELDVHAMRDPTRGGCSAALHEIAAASGVSIVLDEDALPVPDVVQGACALLGTEALEIANEGKALVLLPREQAERALALLRSHRYGEKATMIGRVVPKGAFPVTITTALGERLVDAPRGELLPRIC